MKKTSSKGGKGWTRRAALGASGLGLLVSSACMPKPKARDEMPANGPFVHGIASGDPLQHQIILWTCVSGGGGGILRWEMAATRDFAKVLHAGEVAIAHGKLVPVKVDVDGLSPGAEYFYRFWRGKIVSDIGRTKTLPVGDVPQISLAVVSCSNHPAGYFHSYAHLAKSAPVDAVLALGDYIYEYGLGGFATEYAKELGRVPEPVHECVSYEDYAARYAQYHRDPDLQAAHLAAPWILTWDDHETANDSWRGGAQNHDPKTEGKWAAREAASLRAFYEWTPTREPAPGLPRSANYRRFDFGNLAAMIMIETRLSGRSKTIEWDQYPVPVDADPADPAVQEKIRIFDEDVVGAKERRMLGDAQATFVRTALDTSVAAGQAWQIIGNQTLFTRTRSPNYMETLPYWLKWLVKRKHPFFHKYFLRSRFAPPLNLDAWDGYPAARERFYDKIKTAKANVLVLTGDTHDFNAATLRDDAGAKVGVELGTSGVSSPGNFASINAPGVEFGELTQKANPDMMLHDVYHTGYIRLRVRRDQIEANYISTSDVKQPKWTAKIEHKFKITKTGLARR